jgi:hypothetical protein
VPIEGVSAPAGKQRLKHAAISAFLLFHLVVITCWTAPFKMKIMEAVNQVTRPYLLWIGLFQAWDMFAPNPMTLNGYVDARILYQNGRMETWEFPRMEKLGLAGRYVKERYRKFVNEYLRNDDKALLWPDAARHVARLHYRDPANPPRMIVIRSPGTSIRFSNTPSGLRT